MRLMVVVVGAALLLAAGAEAQTVAEKLCILGAAQKLPPVPGLVIAGSKVTAPPKEISLSGDVGVELSVKAAGVDATFSFICRMSSGSATVQALGVTK